MIDYKALLKKYIQYINDVEGSDYIEPHDNRDFSDINFNDEEWNKLLEISKGLNNES